MNTKFLTLVIHELKMWPHRGHAIIIARFMARVLPTLYPTFNEKNSKKSAKFLTKQRVHVEAAWTTKKSKSI